MSPRSLDPAAEAAGQVLPPPSSSPSTPRSTAAPTSVTAAAPGAVSGAVSGAPSSDASLDSPQVSVFVRAPRRRSRPFELLRLDIWGDTLLGPKLRGELSGGYAILLVVCVFEVCAWSLLFNYVFHGAELRTSLATIPAIFLGALWGIGIFTIDKGLITTDLKRPGWSKYVGLGLRAALVLGAAVLTAEPIEQVVFRSKVEEQLKQERLREEALAYAKKESRLQTRRDDVDQQAERTKVPERIRDSLDEKKRAHEQRIAERKAAELAVRSAEEAQQRAEEKLAQARYRYTKAKQLDPESSETAEAGGRLQSALLAAARAAEATARARGEADLAQTAVGEAERSLGKAETSYDVAQQEIDQGADDKRDRIADEERSIRQFLERLRDSRFGEPLVREDGTPFTWRRAGAVERMVALAQLRNGEPPSWPLSESELRARAADLAGLSGTSSAVDTFSNHVRFLWFLVTLLGAAIPSLSLLFKFTMMSEELKIYYSADAQARAGNPEAIELLRARSSPPTRPALAEHAKAVRRGAPVELH